MRFRRLALALLMMLASMFFGCGASDTATPTDSLESTSPSRRWVGRIRLTGPINGAQIRFLDASGNLLAETTSNAAGVFFATLALPSTFRITASFRGPNGPETFSTVYESAPPARGWLEVNAVTTLIDHYRQRHPELSLDQVEERIRGYFGVPRSRSLRNGVYSLRLSNFNHSLFLRRAREFQGGLPAYVRETVSAIDGQGLLSSQNLGLSGGVGDSTFGPSLPGQFGLSDGGGDDDDDDPFAGSNTGVFNLNSLDDPDEPLPPDPPAVANFNTLVDDDDDGFVNVGDDDESLASDTFDENEYVLVENNLVSEEATAAETAVVDDAEEVSLSSMASGVASAVGSTALRTLGGVVFNLAFQAVLSQFGIGQNSQIEKQLQQIETDITALQNSINNLYAAQMVGFLDTQYAAQADSLGANISYIQGLWGSPIVDERTGYSGAVAAASAGASNGGLDLSESATLLQDFLADASESQLVAALNQIQNNQLGINGAANSMIQLLAQANNYNRYVGIFSTEQLIAQFNTYASFQHQATVMLVAIARSKTPPDLATAQARLKQYNDSLKQQLSQIPFPLDENLIYDRQSGLVIYNQVFPATSLADAIQMASTLEEGGVSGWQVASVTDLQQFTSGFQQPFDTLLRKLGLNTAAAAGSNGYGGNAMTILTVEPQNATVNGFPNPFGNPITYNSTDLSTLSTTSLGTLDANTAQNAVGPFILVGGQQGGLFLETGVAAPASDAAYLNVYLGFNGLNAQGLFSGPVLNAAVSSDGSQCTASTLLQADVEDDDGFTDFEEVPLDVTGFVFWTSSDPDVADVSNAPGQEGQVIRLGGAPGGTVTFTASRMLTNEGNPTQIGPTTLPTSFPTGPITATATFTYPQAPPAQLTSVSLSPRNAQFNGGLPLSQQLYVVGQFSDGTSAELSADPQLGPLLAFTSSDPNLTIVQPMANGGVISGPVVALSTAGYPTNPVTITVSVQGLTDSTTLSFSP
ncbi:MAG: hypothetical protein AMXMBFR33_71220 [Candidatus Xenobia bacterium]